LHGPCNRSELFVQVRGSAQEDLKEALDKEPERSVENEKYEKILGNDALQKKTLVYGDSVVGRPHNGQMVTVSFEGYLKEDRTKLVEHNDNLSFILGDGDVISAMDMVVSLMDKNETCEMIAESRLAYGDIGKQPDIPPKADLVYKIQLLDFKDLTDMNQMAPLERLSLA
jgi:FKBP-type peptidyl-prolyl cis-trans isomerase